ncbi:MAG TPA: hypothetical protein V6D06_13445, partial [Trichocoleus sp.]
MKSPMHLKYAALTAAALGVFGVFGSVSSAIATTTARTAEQQPQTASSQLLAQASQFGEQPVVD